MASVKFRENKAELFTKFIDSVMITAADVIQRRENIPVDIIDSVVHINGSDSVLFALMNTHHATHAIVINSFNVYFDQTRVEVTKTSSGSKEREAYYDIVSEIDFSVYNTDSLIKNKLMTLHKSHSSRPVLSGLFASGPNIVIQGVMDNINGILSIFCSSGQN